MPVDEADLGLDFFYNTNNIVVIAILVFAALWFISLKQLFGSYSIFTIFEQYKERKKTNDRYNRLFETRENLCYHIGWARSRGESAVEIRQMVTELSNIEKSIDEMESKFSLNEKNI